MTDTQKANETRKLLVAIVETVMEGSKDGIGTPGGILYVALMSLGATYDQYERLMAGMVNSGALRKAGDCYHVTELGREFVNASHRVDNRLHDVN